VKDLNNIICNSISEKQIIEFVYDGEIRIVEPFCYGVSTSGNEVLSAYQVGGYSSSGNPDGWKLYRIDAISTISEHGMKFDGNRPNYNPNDNRMTNIYCNI